MPDLTIVVDGLQPVLEEDLYICTCNCVVMITNSLARILNQFIKGLYDLEIGACQSAGERLGML